MIFAKQRLITQTHYVSDIVALLSALVISLANTSVRHSDLTLWESMLTRFSLMNVADIGLLALLWILLFRQNNLYGHRSDALWREALRIGLATGLGTAAIGAVAGIFDLPVVNLGFLLWFWLTVTALTCTLRTLLRSLLKRVHLGDHNVSHVLVVGTSNQAFELAETLRNDPLRSDPLHRCRFLGYVAAGEPASARVAASEIVADPQTAIELLNDQVVDELVVALTLRDITPEVEALMRHAAQLGITVRCPVNQLFSGVYGDEVTRLSSEASRSGTARWAKDLVMRSGYGYSWQYVAKRIFDVVGALALLVITSPLMIAAAIAITTTSRGGVFFIQDRYGYNGRVIRLLKFRTMGQDADAQQARLRAEHNEMDGGAFKMKNDPRVTRVGAFLRKTSIDELPQLFNVLRGEMSLVGPRPLPLADYDHIEQISHLRRLSVLPGITCTWQAGGRNNVSFEQWMALDMAYIDNWSLLEDFRILLKTVPAVLLARGAA